HRCSRGDPCILAGHHPALPAIAPRAEREPNPFGSKRITLPAVTPPKLVQRLLERSLPDRTESVAFSRRIAGVGSLGRPRYVAAAPCNGSFVAREVKAWLPSAWGWANGRPKKHAYSVRLLKRAVRQPDPYYSVE